MKGKIQQSNLDIEQAARALANDEFMVVPGHKVREHKEVVPQSLHGKLESMTFGLTGGHFVAMVHRTDQNDAPKTVNIDLYLYAYNATANAIAATGLLVNRAGEKCWHHREPKDEFAHTISYRDISATAHSFRISGQQIDQVARQALHDALQFKKIEFDS